MHVLKPKEFINVLKSLSHGYHGKIPISYLNQELVMAPKAPWQTQKHTFLKERLIAPSEDVIHSDDTKTLDKIIRFPQFQQDLQIMGLYLELENRNHLYDTHISYLRDLCYLPDDVESRLEAPQNKKFFNYATIRWHDTSAADFLLDQLFESLLNSFVSKTRTRNVTTLSATTYAQNKLYSAMIDSQNNYVNYVALDEIYKDHSTIKKFSLSLLKRRGEDLENIDAMKADPSVHKWVNTIIHDGCGMCFKVKKYAEILRDCIQSQGFVWHNELIPDYQNEIINDIDTPETILIRAEGILEKNKCPLTNNHLMKMVMKQDSEDHDLENYNAILQEPVLSTYEDWYTFMQDSLLVDYQQQLDQFMSLERTDYFSGHQYNKIFNDMMILTSLMEDVILHYPNETEDDIYTNKPHPETMSDDDLDKVNTTIDSHMYELWLEKLPISLNQFLRNIVDVAILIAPYDHDLNFYNKSIKMINRVGYTAHNAIEYFYGEEEEDEYEDKQAKQKEEEFIRDVISHYKTTLYQSYKLQGHYRKQNVNDISLIADSLVFHNILRENEEIFDTKLAVKMKKEGVSLIGMPSHVIPKQPQLN